MEINKKVQMWHSAQPLDNLGPTIIYENKESISSAQHQKRQNIVSKINDIVSSSKRKWSKSSNVIIYYTSEYFVIESTPKDRDSYNRLSPILSYGHFPSKERDEDDWIKEVSTEIDDFVQLINRELSSKTKDMIKTGLKETWKDCKKNYQLDSLAIFLGKPLIFAVAIMTPLLLGWILHEQVPQLIHQQLPILQQNIRTVSLKDLQPVIQNLILWAAGLIAINNVILLGLALLITWMMKNEFKIRNK